MPSSSPRGRTSSRSISSRPRAGRSTRAGKVRKAFWLDPKLLEEARAALGTSSERETIEVALDLVGFRQELAQGARAVRGLALSRID